MKHIRYILVALLLLGAIACKQEAPSSAPESASEGFEMTLQVLAPDTDPELRAHLDGAQGDAALKAFFKAEDDIALFVIQGGKIYDLANIQLASVTNEGKKATITFTLPAGVDTTQPIDIIGYDGFHDFGYKSGNTVNRSYMTIKDGKILINVIPYCSENLGTFQAPVYFKLEGITPTAQDLTNRFVQFNHIGVYEVIYLKNASSEELTRTEVGLSQKGRSRFRATKSWAVDSEYDMATSTFKTPLLDLVTGEVSYTTERQFRRKYPRASNLAAGAEMTLVNWYIPKPEAKLPEMELWLKVKLDSKFSATSIPAKDFAMEVGKAYTVSGTWDGTNISIGEVTIIQPEAITLSKNNISLTIGEEQTLTATITPDNATDKSVVWSSSDSQVVQVTNGTIKGLKVGNATITAKTSNGLTATCEVIVKEVAVESITLSKSTAELKINGVLELIATITPDNATNKKVTWTSSAPAIAEVTQQGRVTAKSAGQATITASAANGKRATCTITVSTEELQVTSITINNGEVEVGSTLKLTYQVLPAEAADLPLVWTSSDNSIAIVENGVVKGIKEGEVTITATAKNNVKGTAKVTVKKSNSSIDDVPGTIL